DDELRDDRTRIFARDARDRPRDAGTRSACSRFSSRLAPAGRAFVRAAAVARVFVEERDAPLLAHSQVMSRNRGKSATASEIGALIRAVREQNGCQQKELAERIGIPASQLSRYEAGTDQPKIQILVA